MLSKEESGGNNGTGNNFIALAHARHMRDMIAPIGVAAVRIVCDTIDYNALLLSRIFIANHAPVDVYVNAFVHSESVYGVYPIGLIKLAASLGGQC